jgi:hypothetical protein
MMGIASKIAKKVSGRFGDEGSSLVGKTNKANKDGYINRSPLKDNANKMVPSLKSDVVGSMKDDIGRIKRGLSASSDLVKNAPAATKVKEAAGRAITRTAVRGAAVGAAFAGGKAVGDAAKARQDEVDKKNAVTVAASKPKAVETKKEAPKAAESKKEAPKAAKKAAPAKKMEERGVREGKNENIDDDVRKRALASVANFNKGGMACKKR